jgi:hypothetical protein
MNSSAVSNELKVASSLKPRQGRSVYSQPQVHRIKLGQERHNEVVATSMPPLTGLGRGDCVGFYKHFAPAELRFERSKNSSGDVK